ACSAANMIAPDVTGGVSKKWQVGSVPQYIYFKMPSSGYKMIYLSLYASDSIYTFNLAQKTLTFTGTSLYCHLADTSYDWFGDYVNGEYVHYRRGIWNDNSSIYGTLFDGIAYESYPYGNAIGLEDKNTPFVVKKGDTLKLTHLKLADTGSYTYNGDTDYITGANTGFPFNSSHFDVTQYSGYKILSCGSLMESAQAVSNTVGIKHLTLPWKVQTSGGSNIASGACDIKVYVPFNTPQNSECPLHGSVCDYLYNANSNDGYFHHHDLLFESLLAISCSAAEGASTQSEVFSHIWNKICTMHIELLDGRVLQYYGQGSNTTNVHDSAAHLLENADGRCGNWSSFFVDLLRSQGIPANYIDNVFAFWVKEIPSEFIAYDQIRGEAYYYGNLVPDYDAVRIIQKGPRFQGGGHPVLAFFADHAINLFNNKLYDATCGKGGYDYSESGFLQYLVENTSVAIYGNIVCSGEELDTDYFMTTPEIPGG
ncbi:MAG: transglutaminase domain-containing protein, partial [Abditibacteriota bacterium]|nr:transglutaminase domain-containing protein [Abditibacteriota bacterium]